MAGGGIGAAVCLRRRIGQERQANAGTVTWMRPGLDRNNRMPPIATISQWVPSASVWSALQQVLGNQALRHLLEEDRSCGLLAGGVGQEIIETQVESLRGPTFVAVGPHTDPQFSRFFTLFVIAGPGTTRLRTWNNELPEDVFNEDREKITRRPDHQVALQPGLMVVFDAHCVHDAWLPSVTDRLLQKKMKASFSLYPPAMLKRLMSEDESGTPEASQLVTLCVSIETDFRPSIAQAEKAMLESIRRLAPNAYAQATEGLIAAPVRRRKP